MYLTFFIYVYSDREGVNLMLSSISVITAKVTNAVLPNLPMGLETVDRVLNGAKNEGNRIGNAAAVVGLIVAGVIMFFNKEKGMKIGMGVLMGTVVIWFAMNDGVQQILNLFG